FQCFTPLLDLLSFPTRRSSDLNPSAEKVSDMPVQTDRLLPVYPAVKGLKSQLVRKILAELKPLMTMLPETLPSSVVANEKLVSRSEEHTSELQSRENLVCRLLL